MDSPSRYPPDGAGDFIKPQSPPEKNGVGGASKEMKAMKEEPPEEWPEEFMENAYPPEAEESAYRSGL